MGHNMFCSCHPSLTQSLDHDRMTLTSMRATLVYLAAGGGGDVKSGANGRRMPIQCAQDPCFRIPFQTASRRGTAPVHNTALHLHPCQHIYMEWPPMWSHAQLLISEVLSTVCHTAADQSRTKRTQPQ